MIKYTLCHFDTPLTSMHHCIIAMGQRMPVCSGVTAYQTHAECAGSSKLAQLRRIAGPAVAHLHRYTVPTLIVTQLMALQAQAQTIFNSIRF